MPAATHNYRPDIDGLRAIAVVAVILYHAGVEPISGGFTGVDVFFVISGFLITSIIVAKVDAGCFSIVDFWERRVRRIIPPLVVVATISLAGSFLLLFPEDYKDFSRSLAAIAVFSSNFLFWLGAGYFDSPAELKPLLHTWSLAIEEQFYLLFPMLLLFLAGGRRKWRTAAIVCICLLSLSISVWWVKSYPDSAFYLLPARAWELGLGALLVHRRFFQGTSASMHFTREFFSGVGLLMIGLSYFNYSAETRFPGVAALLPCVGTALLITSFSNERQTLIHRLLSLRPFVFIGLLSYSLYLWHWPIIVFAKYHAEDELGIRTILIILIVSTLLAYLSWRFIETPIRAKKLFAHRKDLFNAGVLSACLMIAIGAIGHISDGLPQRIDDDTLQLYSGYEYSNPRRNECLNSGGNNSNHAKLCEVGATDSNQRLQFLVVGDSHANSLMPLIEEMAASHGINGLYAMYNGCPPLLGIYRYDTSDMHKCNEFNEYVLSQLIDRNISTVLLVGRWSFYSELRMIRPLDKNMERPSNWLTLGKPDIDVSRQGFKEGLSKMVNRASKGRTVWIMKQSPLQHNKMSPRFLASRHWLGEKVESLGVSIDEHIQHQAFANTTIDTMVANGGGNVTSLDPTAYLCGKNPDYPTICSAVLEGGSVYRDDDHLSTYGTKYLRPLLLPFFESFRHEVAGYP